MRCKSEGRRAQLQAAAASAALGLLLLAAAVQGAPRGGRAARQPLQGTPCRPGSSFAAAATAAAAAAARSSPAHSPVRTPAQARAAAAARRRPTRSGRGRTCWSTCPACRAPRSAACGAGQCVGGRTCRPAAHRAGRGVTIGGASRHAADATGSYLLQPPVPPCQPARRNAPKCEMWAWCGDSPRQGLSDCPPRLPVWSSRGVAAARACGQAALRPGCLSRPSPAPPRAGVRAPTCARLGSCRGSSPRWRTRRAAARWQGLGQGAAQPGFVPMAGDER